MQLTFEPARLTRFAIFAMAATAALSVGACSSHKGTSSDGSSANGESDVNGLIASVSGSSFVVNQDAGTAKVDAGPSAKFDEFSVAQLSDVAAGSCARVVSRPGLPPGSPLTADSVQVGPTLEDGKCWQPKNSPATVPRTLIGPVASVAGNTITVTTTDADGNTSDAAVTVTDTTQYSKDAKVNVDAVAQGKCVKAHGTKDGDTLKATVVTLGPATDGKCPQAAPAGKK